MPTTTTSSKREKIELTKKRLFFDIEVYFVFPEQEGVIDGFANRKKRLQQYIVVPREKKSESISVLKFAQKLPIYVFVDLYLNANFCDLH